MYIYKKKRFDLHIVEKRVYKQSKHAYMSFIYENGYFVISFLLFHPLLTSFFTVYVNFRIYYAGAPLASISPGDKQILFISLFFFLPSRFNLKTTRFPGMFVPSIL